MQQQPQNLQNPSSPSIPRWSALTLELRALRFPQARRRLAFPIPNDTQVNRPSRPEQEEQIEEWLPSLDVDDTVSFFVQKTLHLDNFDINSDVSSSDSDIYHLTDTESEEEEHEDVLSERYSFERQPSALVHAVAMPLMTEAKAPFRLVDYLRYYIIKNKHVFRRFVVIFETKACRISRPIFTVHVSDSMCDVKHSFQGDDCLCHVARFFLAHNLHPGGVFVILMDCFSFNKFRIVVEKMEPQVYFEVLSYCKRRSRDCFVFANLVGEIFVVYSRT